MLAVLVLVKSAKKNVNSIDTRIFVWQGAEMHAVAKERKNCNFPANTGIAEVNNYG